MPINLGNPTWITLVADAATPANLVQYAGMRLPIPAGTALPANGVRDTIVVSGVTVPGYLREDGQGGREWLMTTATDPTVAALDAIPGAAGWTSSTARNTFAQNGQALKGLGVPLHSIATGFTQLYTATQQDLIAKGWTAPAP